jgi:hypothetical protein
MQNISKSTPASVRIPARVSNTSTRFIVEVSDKDADHFNLRYQAELVGSRRIRIFPVDVGRGVRPGLTHMVEKQTWVSCMRFRPLADCPLFTRIEVDLVLQADGSAKLTLPDERFACAERSGQMKRSNEVKIAAEFDAIVPDEDVAKKLRVPDSRPMFLPLGAKPATRSDPISIQVAVTRVNQFLAETPGSELEVIDGRGATYCLGSPCRIRMFVAIVETYD